MSKIAWNLGEKPIPWKQWPDRPKQVMVELATGATNREIGERLGISEKTVKANVSMAFEALGVKNRVRATLALRDLLKVQDLCPYCGKNYIGHSRAEGQVEAAIIG